MRAQPGPGPESRFDRRLLLFGTRRDQVLPLREVQRYGRDSYGNADYVSIYGMPPAQWYARGVRVLGRTAVECTRDRLADLIGQDVAAVARTAPRPDGVLVVDPFARVGEHAVLDLPPSAGRARRGFGIGPGRIRYHPCQRPGMA